MKRLTLSQTLGSMLTLLWFGVGVLVVVSAWMSRSDMLEQRKNMLSQLVDIALGVISYFEKEAADNSLSMAEAKHQALENLRGLRYGADRSAYFGVYDSKVTALLPPPRPDLESKSLVDLVDPNGTHSKRHAEAAPTVQNSNSDSRSLTAARSKASGSKLPPHHSSSCSWSS